VTSAELLLAGSMKTESRCFISQLLASSLLLAACGGTSPPAESPTSEPAAASSSSTSAQAASAAAPSAAPPPAATGEGKKTAAQEPPSTAGPATSKRSPRDVLELKDTVFFIVFDESDPRKKAEAACAKSASKDPKKMTPCMAKAREQIVSEGYRFEMDKSGDWWWLVVRRKGNALTTVHRLLFTYGEETSTSIVIKPEGKDLGSKPWKKPPATLKFEVPTDYRLVVRDPQQGKLVYEAKSGLATGN